MNFSTMEIKALKAERSFLVARLAFVNARLGKRSSRTTASPAELGDKFDKAWKKGTRLTPAGKIAVKKAFASGMKQSVVARMFKISSAAANIYHKAWKAEG